MDRRDQRSTRIGGVRRLTAIGTVAVGAILVPAGPLAGVAHADPSEEEIREQIQDLEQELSALNEDYNQAQEDHEAAESRLEQIEQDLAAAEEAVDDRSGEVRRIANAAYTGAEYSTLSVFLDGQAEDSGGLLHQLSDLTFLAGNQQHGLGDYLAERERLDGLYDDVAETEEEAAAALADAEEAYEEGEAALAEQEALLEEVGGDESPGQAQATDSDGGGGSSAPDAASGDVQAVLDFAYDQIGKPYVWGGTGPDGYDCSGLTQAAWAQAGVDLPRVSQDQFHAGTSVSRDEVQPGDLLFFYDSSAPTHVGIYAGDGKMVHGSNPSKPIEEVDLAAYWDGVFVGAVRPS
ncbi:NlpC/P60 family protein [Lipingzhangella sp. LS1_29]|uniref:NlpC/P60 family protein n=1 Tax=Lipingzhangella rawalii TaxID=2055835 RepID=A0ABU2H6Z0_9ACTN|nr:NlpC/P60 family protein [Lipingzhangella rawalii]MDS1270590.1 NlpC/P60 family protein [Lipingzhangella rawalii]